MEAEAGAVIVEAAEAAAEKGGGEGWVAVTFSRSPKVYYYKTRDESQYSEGQQLPIHNEHGVDVLTVVAVGQGPGSGTNRTYGGQFLAYKYIEERMI